MKPYNVTKQANLAVTESSFLNNFKICLWGGTESSDLPYLSATYFAQIRLTISDIQSIQISKPSKINNSMYVIDTIFGALAVM